jgi:hypothetical protein
MATPAKPGRTIPAVQRDDGVAQDEQNYLHVMNMLASFLWMKGRGLEALQVLRQLSEVAGRVQRLERPR